MLVGRLGGFLVFLLFDHFFDIVLHVNIVRRFGVIKGSRLVGYLMGRNLGLLFDDCFVENLVFGTKVVGNHKVAKLLQKLILEQHIVELLKRVT